jgi:hypothetical protein
MGTLHALALLTCIALTELAASRYHRVPSIRRVVGAIAAGLALAAFSASLGLHMCGRGDPVQQWAIPSICLALGVAFVGHVRVRRTLAAALAMIAVIGSLHYAALVHGDAYVGQAMVTDAGPDGPLRSRPVWHTPLTGLYALD